jgi:hypothetical protein
MIQDTQTIRLYQKLTDNLSDLWQRGDRFDDLRLYVEGYVTALRHLATLESTLAPHLINRLEEEANLFLFDLVHLPALETETSRNS